MALSDRVRTFGQHLRSLHGERVHKIALNAGLSCPNRDGTKGRGGCIFCNNGSFTPRDEGPPPIHEQIAAGRAVVARRTGARKLIAYFQAYTNTHSDLGHLRALYDQALAEEDVLGLSVGTRPDCLPPAVLDLLCEIRDQGKIVWLELGLQSSFDATLERVRRGHTLEDYRQATLAARDRGIPVCTHLIVGMPGESALHARVTLDRVLELGIDGLKLHPLHVVKNTLLAKAHASGEYVPWTLPAYLETAADLIERTPETVFYHRVTGTCPPELLIAPEWCGKKWEVINGIEATLARRGTRQGSRLRRLDSMIHTLVPPALGCGYLPRHALELTLGGGRR
ncbi:MAG: TIGR01212 family radical SAM protein [Deltaproteobacteria bacterium]|nr:TIGR01212 family radical SAM protein [Deltaproteobacteria bacterium]